MKLKQKIIDLHFKRPDLTVRQIAESLIAHPHYVRRIGRECGLKFAPGSQPKGEAA